MASVVQVVEAKILRNLQSVHFIGNVVSAMFGFGSNSTAQNHNSSQDFRSCGTTASSVEFALLTFQSLLCILSSLTNSQHQHKE
jgi:hypothetical protein